MFINRRPQGKQTVAFEKHEQIVCNSSRRKSFPIEAIDVITGKAIIESSN